MSDEHEVKEVNGMRIRVFVVCLDFETYEEAQREFSTYDWAYVVSIDPTLLMANEFLGEWLVEHVYTWDTCDYVGFLPYYVYKEYGMIEDCTHFYETMRTALDNNKQVVPLYPSRVQKDTSFITEREKERFGFLESWMLIARDLGFSVQETLDYSKPFYGVNAWCMDAGELAKYIKWLIPVKDMVENKKHITSCCMRKCENNRCDSELNMGTSEQGVKKNICDYYESDFMELFFSVTHNTSHSMIFNELFWFYVNSKKLRV